MKIRARAVAWIAAVCTVAAVCAPVRAAAGARSRGSRRPAAAAGGVLAPRVAAALQLTRAQRVRIDAVTRRARKQLTALRQRIETDQALLRSELSSQDPDEARVSALIRRIGALETEARKVRVFAWLDVRKLLSAQQRRQLRALYAARRRRRHRQVR